MIFLRYFNVRLEQDRSDNWKVTGCAINVAQREKRHSKCSLLRTTEVLMLWAFWMDKNTSHSVTPPQKRDYKEYQECVVMIWEQRSGKQR